MQKSKKLLLFSIGLFICCAAILPTSVLAGYRPPEFTTKYAIDVDVWGTHVGGTLADTRTSNGIDYQVIPQGVPIPLTWDMFYTGMVEFEFEQVYGERLVIDYYMYKPENTWLTVKYTDGSSQSLSVNNGYRTYILNSNKKIRFVVFEFVDVIPTDPNDYDYYVPVMNTDLIKVLC